MTNDVRPPALPDRVGLRELAREGFARDLPRLLPEHLGSLVAYHGDRQIAIARHSGELHEICRQQHLSLDEVALFEVAAPDEEILFGPMAFD